MPSEATQSDVQIVKSAEAAEVRDIVFADLTDALNKGMDDFKAKPSHPVFVALVYPAAMAVAITFTMNINLLPLAFPVISGAVLLGPAVALGLYELSRRRELGEEVSWMHAFTVPKSEGFGEILKLGGLLTGLVLVWFIAAWTLYYLTIGEVPLESPGDFINRVFLTQAGWTMIVVGNVFGFLFAVMGFSISVVSFPMILDRHVSIGVAVATSIAAVRANPVNMAMWGLVVVGALFIGLATALVGLVVVMPVLGHATWHLYKRVVV